MPTKKIKLEDGTIQIVDSDDGTVLHTIKSKSLIGKPIVQSGPGLSETQATLEENLPKPFLATETGGFLGDTVRSSTAALGGGIGSAGGPIGSGIGTILGNFLGGAIQSKLDPTVFGPAPDVGTQFGEGVADIGMSMLPGALRFAKSVPSRIKLQGAKGAIPDSMQNFRSNIAKKFIKGIDPSVQRLDDSGQGFWDVFDPNLPVNPKDVLTDAFDRGMNPTTSQTTQSGLASFLENTGGSERVIRRYGEQDAFLKARGAEIGRDLSPDYDPSKSIGTLSSEIAQEVSTDRAARNSILEGQRKRLTNSINKIKRTVTVNESVPDPANPNKNIIVPVQKVVKGPIEVFETAKVTKDVHRAISKLMQNYQINILDTGTRNRLNMILREVGNFRDLDMNIENVIPLENAQRILDSLDHVTGKLERFKGNDAFKDVLKMIGSFKTAINTDIKTSLTKPNSLGIDQYGKFGKQYLDNETRIDEFRNRFGTKVGELLDESVTQEILNVDPTTGALKGLSNSTNFQALRNVAGDDKARELLWAEGMRQASSESQLIDADKMLSYLRNKRDLFESVMSSDQRAAINNFWHQIKLRDRLKVREDAKLKMLVGQAALSLGAGFLTTARGGGFATSAMRGGEILGAIMMSNKMFTNLMFDPKFARDAAKLAGPSPGNVTTNTATRRMLSDIAKNVGTKEVLFNALNGVKYVAQITKDGGLQFTGGQLVNGKVVNPDGSVSEYKGIPPED